VHPIPPQSRSGAFAGQKSRYFYPKDFTSGCTLEARNTFLIDPEGKVAKVFLGVQPSGHSAEVLGT
jgi:peroxiredoxin